jgi:peroxiredoxin
MRLKAPCDSIPFTTLDIYGDSLSLVGFRGKRVILSFFRDAGCPLCHFRIQGLVNHYNEWKAKGLEIIAIFSSTAKEVRKYAARYPMPFRVIADPNLSLYQQYGIERSSLALFKGFVCKLPSVMRGILTDGHPCKFSHVKIVPADFLLEVDGSIAELWYGRDAANSITFERIERFADRLAEGLSIQESIELKGLRYENKKLKILLQQAKLESRVDVQE